MSIEIQDIIAFVSAHEPFDSLPADEIAALCGQIEVSYYQAQSQILHHGASIDALYMIRSGSVEVFRRTGELHNRLEPGDVFGQMGILLNGHVRYPVRALEDTLIYRIPAEKFLAMCDLFGEFGDYFETNEHSTLQHLVQSQDDENDMTTVRVRDIIQSEPVYLTAGATVRECAQQMTEQNVSSVVIFDQLITVESSDDVNANEGASLALGIVTDRDFRVRVLAAGLSLETPLRDVMSTDLITVAHDAYVYEAKLLMMRHNVHHLPLVRHDKVTGIVALTDIVQYESQSSLLLVRGILVQETVEGLAELSSQVASVMVRMQKEGANSRMIGGAMSVIGRTFKQRLLALAEEKFGAPPVPYCFLALGSMAREEQLLVTDQDNALILSADYNEAKHGDYFKQLSDFVCDGLNACGYTYCDGGIMASNPKWRLTLKDWKLQFSEWIEKPDPQALLNASIFFDLEGVDGKVAWAEQLTRFIVGKAKTNRSFLAALARNAMNRTPPLGFFKDFVLEKDGRQRYSLNLKRRGTAPMVDVIRVHALAEGSLSQNSFDRLEDLKGSSLLPDGKKEELSDALEYLSMIRIRQQVAAVEAGEQADNTVEPETLSSKERRGLKEAFQVLSSAQKFLKFRYTAHQKG
ncbi:MAG: cyclic nucleotide-binding/CBS domain-containing protein [Oleispira antarctica]|nr:cyclic nucleotide-binding/CBS domain-containing protein [Oleispira antarctica]MBQ0791218.1 cyclic nucleotide-binding/CBS domain-containing protein [Oleispira antarctica]